MKTEQELLDEIEMYKKKPKKKRLELITGSLIIESSGTGKRMEINIEKQLLPFVREKFSLPTDKFIKFRDTYGFAAAYSIDYRGYWGVEAQKLMKAVKNSSKYNRLLKILEEKIPQNPKINAYVNFTLVDLLELARDTYDRTYGYKKLGSGYGSLFEG